MKFGIITKLRIARATANTLIHSNTNPIAILLLTMRVVSFRQGLTFHKLNFALDENLISLLLFYFSQRTAAFVFDRIAALDVELESDSSERDVMKLECSSSCIQM